MSDKSDNLDKLKKLEKKIGYTFKDKSFLEQALMHNSYINENDMDFIESNERLEFLGDALLDGVVAEMLYKMYPKYTEGELSLAKANLVSRQCLGEVAGSLKLGKFLNVGQGIKSAKDNNFSILSCAIEALLAAIYLDGGDKALRDAVTLFLGDRFKDMELVEQENYKGKLQRITQGRFAITPTYKLLEQKGPDHSKEFTVGVFLDEKMVASGFGTSKKKAELDAAKKAIEEL